MKIKIRRRDILHQVMQLSAYAGAKNGDFDRVATVKVDDALLNRYFDREARNVAMSLRGALRSYNIDGNGAVYELNRDYAPSTIALATESIADCLTQSVAASWFQMLKNEDAAECKAIAEAILDDVARAILIFS